MNTYILMVTLFLGHQASVKHFEVQDLDTCLKLKHKATQLVEKANRLHFIRCVEKS